MQPAGTTLPINPLAQPGLVSVVIPTYQRAYIVGDAIASVLSQTYRPIEVIVVDDGSTDDTRRLVEAFGTPVRYVYQPNAGVCAARNRGLVESRGEFIALLDSDDRWLPWKIAAQVALMRQFPEVGMVWTDMSAVNREGTLLHEAYLRVMYHAHRTVSIEDVCVPGGRLAGLWTAAPSDIADRPFYKGDIFSEMILGNLVHTSTVLLRRSRLVQVGGFDESLGRSGEDYEFHLRTCSYGEVGFLDASSTIYRTGAADQLTAPEYGLQVAANNLTTVRRWLAKGKGRIRLPRATVRRHLAACYAWLGNEKYVAGQRWSGRADHLRSLALRPWQPALWLSFGYSFVPRTIKARIRASLKAGGPTR